MKKLCLCMVLLLAGCGASTTTPPAAIAPGYSTPFDQTAGQTLAAAHALVGKAITDYPTLSPSQQATEKPVLNALVAAVNSADSVYLAFHSGQASQAQVQAKLDSVAVAQSNFTAQGVK